ncbi:MAG TPA: low molecular weight phosphatase family protein [Gammaproteobacteria bacterium]
MIAKIIRKMTKRLRVLQALRHAVSDTEQRLANKKIHKILVLCYGNIYRSPLVAQYLLDNLETNVEVRSAGFHPKPNRPSPEAHVKMCAEYNIDLTKHRSTVISRELTEWADRIVIMDKHNWYALADYGDEALAKAVWLGALLGRRAGEILDPYGKPENEARAIVQQLLESSKQLVARLK